MTLLYPNEYNGYSAQVAIKESYNGNYWGVLLFRNLYKKKIYWDASESFFIFADAIISLETNLGEIAVGIANGKKNYKVGKDSQLGLVKPIYRKVFNKRKSSYYRIELYPGMDKDSEICLASDYDFVCDDLKPRTISPRFSMPEYISDMYSKMLPKLISTMRVAMSTNASVLQVKSNVLVGNKKGNLIKLISCQELNHGMFYF